LRFLVDLGVSVKVEEYLKREGFLVKSVREINPRMHDTEILKIASREHLMVITMDKDFGELVYNSGQQHSGVLILRLDNANGQEKVEVVKEILSEYAEKIVGNFCVFQNGKLRIRH
jgi:predicted nuclease of predicted toxin-antitoxin system